MGQFLESYPGDFYCQLKHCPRELRNSHSLGRLGQVCHRNYPRVLGRATPTWHTHQLSARTCILPLVSWFSVLFRIENFPPKWLRHLAGRQKDLRLGADLCTALSQASRPEGNLGLILQIHFDSLHLVSFSLVASACLYFCTPRFMTQSLMMKQKGNVLVSFNYVERFHFKHPKTSSETGNSLRKQGTGPKTSLWGLE